MLVIGRKDGGLFRKKNENVLGEWEIREFREEGVVSVVRVDGFFKDLEFRSFLVIIYLEGCIYNYIRNIVGFINKC